MKCKHRIYSSEHPKFEENLCECKKINYLPHAKCALCGKCLTAIEGFNAIKSEGLLK